MQLYVYDADLTLMGLIEKIDSLIWTRRYWSCGEFKLLVPFEERHVELLQKRRLLMKKGDNEAGEIRYVHIIKNSQGMEQIEAQGRFLTNWIGKRVVLNQIVTTDTTPNILNRIARENVVAPANPVRRIPNIDIADASAVVRGEIEYASEFMENALLACETAAKASKIGFGIVTDIKAKRHTFRTYDGRDLTADNGVNPPCIFSQEFDNILEQEYTNSIENLRTAAYVGGEDKPDTARRVVEVGTTAAGLERDEVFVNATDITQTYKNESGVDVTMSDAQYGNMLGQRGEAELGQYAETLAFSSKVNTSSNLKYKEDYDLGDRVTCKNLRWGIKIDVRITEISEIYQQNIEEVEITFGESLPALITQIRHAIAA